VTVSDPAMSETTTLLKAGATDLVLRMAEAGTVLPGLTLDNPVRAIGEVSRDITGPRPPPAGGLIPLPPGRRVPDLAAGLRVPGPLAPAGHAPCSRAGIPDSLRGG